VAVAIALSGAALLIAASFAPTSRFLSRSDGGDIERYHDYAENTFAGRVPYRDFILDYPPGILPIVLAPGPADDGYYDRFRVLMLALGVAAMSLIVAALYHVGAGATQLAMGVLPLATLPLTLSPGLVFERFDLWPAVLVLFAVVALLRRRRLLGQAVLGIATAAKLYPVALVPLALLGMRGCGHVRREVTAFAAAFLAVCLPFMLVGPWGVGHVAKVLVLRPLHVESLGGSALLAAHRLGIYKPKIYLSIGSSWDLAGPTAKAFAFGTSLAQAAALFGVWFLFARGPRGSREFLLAVAAAVAAFVAFGKVFSPQYVVWLVAAVPLALGRMRLFALAATVVAAYLTRYIYVDGYDELLRAGRVSWVMLARNALVVAVFCSLTFELAVRARAPQAPGAAAGGGQGRFPANDVELRAGSAPAGLASDAEDRA
jgi:uncharacterized membrane protein